MSPVCIGFKEVCALDKEPLKEIKGSRPGRRKAEVKIDLDDEPGCCWTP